MIQANRSRRGALILALALFFAPSAVLGAPAETARLDRGETLTRIAFGSCNRQDLDQAVWTAVAQTSPQVFLALGDNVYADRGWRGDARLQGFRDAYAQQASHPEFRAFRRRVPTYATWDDHDFGSNDAGGDFAYKQASEEIFEAFWHSDEAVRGRPGVYQALTVGPKHRRVQLILLDTRYFRTPLRRGEGRYVPDDDPAQQMLGKAQWRWLESELARPADLRIVASSIQVLSKAHPFEKWANLPREREHLLKVLARRAGGEVVVLSGDRHMGGIYSADVPAMGETLWEITSSSLNSPIGSGDVSAREPDPLRRSPLYAGANFGLVDIDWAARTVTLRLLDAAGWQVASAKVGF